MKKVKITIIGGGSRQWAIGMLKDLTRQKDMLPHVCLYDINVKAAKENEQIAKRIFAINNAQGFEVSVADNYKDALTGCDFVVISVEPGSIVCRYGDLEIPESYGILQTVGDTTGPGGLLRAKRAIPMFIEFAKMIEKYCPKAWVINYTNPMTLCTAALFKGFPEIKAMGCCHEVFHTETFLAEKCKTWFGADVDRRDVEIDVSGVNHFTFMPKATWNGHDLIEQTKKYIEEPGVLDDKTAISTERRDNELWFTNEKVVALKFLRDYGVLGAAGDRHLSEFVDFFLTTEENILENGFTRTPYWWRCKKDKIKKTMVFKDDELIAKPNDEEGVDIMLSLIGARKLHTNVNIINKGQVSYLPLGHVVESMSDISCDSIVPCKAIDLPVKVQEFVQHIAKEQEIALDAIIAGDDEKLFEAVKMDPLCRKLTEEQAREMYNKMLDECKTRY